MLHCTSILAVALLSLLFNTVGAEVANGDSTCLCMP